MSTQRICMWSGPRNVSTALMYSFAQRSDTQAVDEPLYAHYLRVSGADHPGRERILASQDPDGQRVIRDVVLGAAAARVLFIKSMAHHLVDLDWSFLDQVTSVILTRDPREVLPSLARKLPDPRIDGTGYPTQVALLRHIEASGKEPIVMDARELLLNPESVLSQLCDRLGIGFEPQMLHWPQGRRPEDGVWADIWYHDVHLTTGFAPYRPRTAPFPDELGTLLDECRPLYQQLMRFALSA